MLNTKTINDVIDERKRQDKKWGTPAHTDGTWLAILTEEIGEVAKEVLCGGRTPHGYELRQELIQVAAVALAWVEDIDDSTIILHRLDVK